MAKSVNLLLQACNLLSRGFSYREISSALRIGHSTITRISSMWEESGYSLEELQSMDPANIHHVFYPAKERDPAGARAQPDFEAVYVRVNRKKASTNLRMEWETYKQEYPDGYQYTQYVKLYHRWCFENKKPDSHVAMTVQRKAGQYIYLDWAGDTILLVEGEKVGDPPQEAHLFVTTVGISSKIFAKCYPNEQTPAAIDGILSAIKFYDALPEALRPDNMSTCVKKHTREEVLLTTAFSDLQAYLGIPILPAPPYKPKAKATVERAVRWAEERILGRLYGRIFPSFDVLNQEVENIVNEMNKTIKFETGKSRNQLFEEVDLPEMGKVPEEPYRYCDFSVCTVPNSYHIKFDDHYYSVPYHLYSSHEKRQVFVKAGLNVIDICSMEDNTLICSHRRGGPDKYITNPKHMPANHVHEAAFSSRGSDYYLNRARDIGVSMGLFIERLLARQEYVQQAYRSCDAVLGMVSSSRNYAAANAAADRCLQLGDITMSGFQRTFKKINSGTTGGISRQSGRKDGPAVRGKDYYK